MNFLTEAKSNSALRRAFVEHELGEGAASGPISLAFLPFELPAGDQQLSISERYHSKSFEVYAAKTAPLPDNLNHAPEHGDLSYTFEEFATECSEFEEIDFFDLTLADLADCSCECAELALDYGFE